MKNSSLRIPSHLAPPTRRWVGAVVSEYALEEHHFRLLLLAGEAWDRTQEARTLLGKEGLVVDGRQGLKPHPAVAIERDSRAAFARLIRELDLDCGIPSENRPPGLRSNRRRQCQ